MSERSYKLDVTRSSLVLRTKATGLLARLAHDLALRAARWEGEGRGDDKDTATVRVHALDVQGVIKSDGRVDSTVLSSSDVQTILSKVQDTLFHGRPVAIEGALTGTSMSLTVVTAKGRETVTARASRKALDERSVEVDFESAVSLKALGVPPIEGPLGAFKVHDRVEVRAHLVWSLAS